MGSPAIRNKINENSSRRASEFRRSEEGQGSGIDPDSPTFSTTLKDATAAEVGIFAIADRKGSRSGFLKRLFYQSRTMEQVSLIILFILLASAFVLVRKRQLLRRILAAIFRFLRRLRG